MFGDYQLKLSFDETWEMDKPHFHDKVEFLLSLSEEGHCFAGDKLYPVKRGSLFIFDELTLHKSIVHDSYKRLVIHVSKETLKKYVTKTGNMWEELRSIPAYTLLAEADVLKLEAAIMDMAQPFGDDFSQDIKKSIAFFNFIITILDVTTRSAVVREVKSFNLERVEPILDYLNKNLAQHLTLNKIADDFFISKYYLSHIFKQATGFSVMEYVVHRRIIKARELLQQGHNVQETGELVGFQNNSHFIRTFKAIIGVSPKQYVKSFDKV